MTGLGGALNGRRMTCVNVLIRTDGSDIQALMIATAVDNRAGGTADWTFATALANCAE